MNQAMFNFDEPLTKPPLPPPPAPTRPTPMSKYLAKVKRNNSKKKYANLEGWEAREGRETYDPRLCRKRIVEQLAAKKGTDYEWVWQGTLTWGCNMNGDAVRHMLGLLVKWGRIEIEEEYLGQYKIERFTKPPPERYKGYSIVYRLADKPEPT